jgi:hypothetical protein
LTTRTLCAQYTDFLDRAQLLTQKLLKQGCLVLMLMELSNLNSGCADAAEILILVKWEVDYWKSEFITFVEEYF